MGRQNSTINKYSKIFHEPPASGSDFFSELAGRMTDLDFAHSNKIVTRSYLNAYVWDPRYEKRPYKVFPMMKGASSRLEELYTNESLFDKFQISCSTKDSSFVTGSYGSFSVINWETGETCRCETQRKTFDGTLEAQMDIEPQFDRNKALVVDWHPDSGTVGVGVGSRLYVYSLCP